MANQKTLFHLVPVNGVAKEALGDLDNERFVSKSRDGSSGLEVGYHVPSIPGGHVITTLGRQADLILRRSSPESPMSGVHVAFQLNPATGYVVLSVRSGRPSSVQFGVLPPKEGEDIVMREASSDDSTAEEPKIGGGVILYGTDYRLTIGSYQFELLWYNGSPEVLAMQGYDVSKELVKHVRSRDRLTERDDTEVLSWHITRLDAARALCFEDLLHLREEIGSGAFGKVYKAIDRTEGHLYAVKKVLLNRYGDVEIAREFLKREIKVMEGLKHPHIIEFLGYQHVDTLCPEIFMPLREGSLPKLIRKSPDNKIHDIFSAVSLQILGALDFMANQDIIHRDVKPDNILYRTLPNNAGWRFQLADFGLANYRSLAKTVCGTGYYQAPELRPETSQIVAPQSPKMDVWSLFATMAAIKCRFRGFPPSTPDYGVVLRALKDIALEAPPAMRRMASLHPDRRASAAQMLVALHNGQGLTTPRRHIPRLEVED